jgi:TetR/AcrR family transcriptional repressor of mexJK operon
MDQRAGRKRGRPTSEERERRQEEILDAAVGLFVSRGFRAVALDDIAAAAHVTKRTLYTYFGDKTEIFVAAVARLRRRALELSGRRCDTLARLATEIVAALHSDEAIGLHRLMITEAASFPDLADRFYAEGPRAYITALDALLPTPDPGRATQLFSLLLGESHRRRLLGLAPAPSRAQARGHAAAALEALGLSEPR